MDRWSAAVLATPFLSLAFAAVCFAQTDSAIGSGAPTQAAPGATNTASPQAPQETKKVWTNDDLAGAPDKSAFSSTGNSRTNARRTAPGHYSSESLVRSYRAQIDNLQKQIADLDKQIAELQAALSGKIVDEPRKYNPIGGRIGDWNAEVEQLQKRRQKLQSQIDSLEKKIRQVNP